VSLLTASIRLAGAPRALVRPALVAEAVFTEWTDEGKIRYPSFQGLRRDRDPKSGIRERPAETPLPASGSKTTPPGGGTGIVVRGVQISNADRIMFERPPLTKLDLVRYYDRVTSAMLPHVEGRPLTLVRCGRGVPAGCMYMKHSNL